MNSQQLEKNCPYCAETIKAEAVLCRFCNNNLQNPYVSNQYQQPQVLGCPSCNTQMVATSIKGSAITFTGMLGSIVFMIAAIVSFVFYPLLGMIVIAIGLIASFITLFTRKKSAMVCPSCGFKGRTLK